MVSKKNKIILLLPPRTGGKSLVKALKNAGMVFDPPVNVPNHPTTNLKLSEILKVWDISMDELHQYTVFQLVRHPFDRFMSSYLNYRSTTGSKITLDNFFNKILTCRRYFPSFPDYFYKNFHDEGQKEQLWKSNNWGGSRDFHPMYSWNDLFISNNKYHVLKLEELNRFEKPYDLNGFLETATSDPLIQVTKKFPHLNKTKNPLFKNYRVGFSHKFRVFLYKIFKYDILSFEYDRMA